MTYSSAGKYRGSRGTLTVGSGKLVFTRMDGLISKKERVIVTIPTNAIMNVNVEGMIRKKLVVLVDGTKVPGIPRHEFEIADPYQWKNAIQSEMASKVVKEPQLAKEVHVKEIVREIVKVPCRYCGTLNEITEKKCSSCGASIEGK